MLELWNEGHLGFDISEIAAQAPKPLPCQPKAVLVTAGTNENILSHDPVDVGARWGL